MSLEQFSILIAAAVFVLFLLLYFLSRNLKSGKWKQTVIYKLNLLQKLYSTKEEIKVKSALIDADKLLDYVLIKKGIKGRTLGERLKNARSLFPFDMYRKVWEAHKVRNNLVHQLDYSPDTKSLSAHFWSLRTAIVKQLD